MPSNGTEGMHFEDEFCHQCMFQHPDPNNGFNCNDVLLKAYCGEQPEEWIYDSQGKPTCTKFVSWNWGDKDGGWNDPRDPNNPLAPIDPSQLLIPFDITELFGFNCKDIAVTRTAIFETSTSN